MSLCTLLSTVWLLERQISGLLIKPEQLHNLLLVLLMQYFLPGSILVSENPSVAITSFMQWLFVRQFSLIDNSEMVSTGKYLSQVKIVLGNLIFMMIFGLLGLFYPFLTPNNPYISYNN